jgi:hypothetical protein
MEENSYKTTQTELWNKIHQSTNNIELNDYFKQLKDNHFKQELINFANWVHYNYNVTYIDIDVIEEYIRDGHVEIEL